MLRIAVQSKGRLFEDTMNLLKETGIKISSSKRTLLVQSSNFPLEVLFLRDDDIPQTVADGVADVGNVGENEFVERNENADVVKRLGFSKCRISLAIPKTIDYPGVEWFNGKKIATSYPVILRKFMEGKGVNTEIHVIQGSVEIAPGIGLADGIFDIVSSGSTLVSNNLKEVEVVMQSEALLIGNKGLSPEKKAILDDLLFLYPGFPRQFLHVHGLPFADNRQIRREALLFLISQESVDAQRDAAQQERQRRDDVGKLSGNGQRAD